MRTYKLLRRGSSGLREELDMLHHVRELPPQLVNLGAVANLLFVCLGGGEIQLGPKTAATQVERLNRMGKWGIKLTVGLC